jgi:hypothetical protein
MLPHNHDCSTASGNQLGVGHAAAFSVKKAISGNRARISARGA